MTERHRPEPNGPDSSEPLFPTPLPAWLADFLRTQDFACLTPPERPQRLVLERVASTLRAEGYRVTTLRVEVLVE